MRSLAAAFVLLFALTSHVRAGDPIVVKADLGIDFPFPHTYSLSCYPDHSSTHQPAFRVDVDYRLIDQLAAGIHFGARQYPWEQCGGNIPGAYQMYRGIDTALELGVGAQWSMNRFWAASWLGFQQEPDYVGLLPGRSLAYAFAVGVDVYADPSGHRLGVYADLTNAEGSVPSYPSSETHFSAGVAYRYW